MNAKSRFVRRDGGRDSRNPVYNKNKSKTSVPKCIYFYYIKGNDVLAYTLEYDDIKGDDVESKIKRVLKKIRKNNIRPSGWQLGDIRWRRKSWFILVMDDPDDPLEEGNAVSFTYEEDGPGKESFCNGEDLELPGKITAFYCKNDLVFNDAKQFDKLCIKVNHKHPERSHQDSGTNMGPPIPP